MSIVSTHKWGVIMFENLVSYVKGCDNNLINTSKQNLVQQMVDRINPFSSYYYLMELHLPELLCSIPMYRQ